jgi:hypothetical protein
VRRVLRSLSSIRGGLHDSPRERGGRHRLLAHARLVLLAGVIPLALASAALFPPTAGADETNGYHVHNASSYPLVLDAILSGTFGGGAPQVGSIVEPGVGYHDFELTYYFLRASQGEARYLALNNNGQAADTLHVFFATDGIRNTFVRCTADVGTCTPAATGPPWLGFNWVDGTDITYVDPPGTVHNLPADQGQAQKAALSHLCADDNAATCQFTIASEVQLDSPLHQAGNAIINNTNATVVLPDQQDLVQVSSSNGVFVALGSDLFAVIFRAVSNCCDRAWTALRPFDYGSTTPCPAHNKCWLAVSEPIIRDSGAFTIKLGNTTWNLPAVYFDSPNPNGGATWEINAQPLTSTQRRSLPKRVTTVKGGPRPYRIRRGTRIVRPKLHVAIAGPTVARPGSTATYRITVSRSQSRHKLMYAVKNVRVIANHARDRVGRWRLATLKPGRSRVQLLTMTIPKTGTSICLRVNATAKHTASGTAITCTAVGNPPSGGRG